MVEDKLSSANRLTIANTLSTSSLKIIAIIAMVCDHAPYLLDTWQADYYTWPWTMLHSIGRITAPVFFYLLALGYRHTRNAGRYTVRLLVFALLSYIPYIWYFNDVPPDAYNFYELNVIFTMLFGLLLLRALHEVSNVALKAVIIVLCFIGGYWCDYGLYGLAMILICDITRGSRCGTVLGMGAVIMVYVYMRTSSFFPSGALLSESLSNLMHTEWMHNLLILLLCQLVPLIFIARHRAWAEGGNAERRRRPGVLVKYGFYIFYPAHIIVLLIIRMYFM